MKPINLKNILVLDIETVSGSSSLEKMPEALQELWIKKYSKDDNDPRIGFYEKGAIFPEFGKIVCISVGFYYEDEKKQLNFRVKAVYNHDEVELLKEFSKLLEKFNNNIQFVAHNGKEFDYPYIARRMMINGIKLPNILDSRGKKPWEVQHLDTMELWKFGDRKPFTSLALLAAVFQLPTSKDDIDGSQVTSVYYEQNDLKRIAKYCNKDVILTGQLFLKLMELPILDSDKIDQWV